MKKLLNEYEIYNQILFINKNTALKGTSREGEWQLQYIDNIFVKALSEA